LHLDGGLRRQPERGPAIAVAAFEPRAPTRGIEVGLQAIGAGDVERAVGRGVVPGKRDSARDIEVVPAGRGVAADLGDVGIAFADARNIPARPPIATATPITLDDDTR
jgi:hypothetical protein